MPFFDLPIEPHFRDASVQVKVLFKSSPGDDMVGLKIGGRSETSRSAFNMSHAPITFYDRRGIVVAPDAHSIIKPRRGVFALVVAGNANAVMLSAEACAPDVPELPGGGIEDGETLDEAIKREWSEEVGIAFEVTGPLQRFQQVRGFYADDRNEFWIYDQTFLRYRFLDQATVGQKWLNPEGGTAGWEPIASLPQLSINRAHWLVIPALLSGVTKS